MASHSSGLEELVRLPDFSLCLVYLGELLFVVGRLADQRLSIALSNAPCLCHGIRGGSEVYWEQRWPGIRLRTTSAIPILVGGGST